MRRTAVAATLTASSALAVLPVRAADLYVAPDGHDSADGSSAAPFATLGRAQQAAGPGDTVWIRGGRYAFAGTASGSEVGIALSKSGREGAPIRYFAAPGEAPVFDFSALRPAARIKGMSVTGSWLHLRGLTITGVQQVLIHTNESWAIRVEGGASHDVFELLDLHHNEGPGLFIADGADNEVLNVDAHHNFDPDRDGENADGFGCHAKGGGNVFRGCRAWSNSDDGFDFINAAGVCTVERSWSFRNGFRPDTNTAAGNGAGFKGGGFTVANPPTRIPRHVLRFNVAWANRSQGFYANHHEGGLDFVQNTAFDNGARNFDLLADEGPAPHLLRNNLAFGKGGALANANRAEIDTASNSWDLALDTRAADVLSVSDRGADGPRQPDGSLPFLPFLRPAPSGALIDRGQALGFPFRGAAPDLGAYESGDVAATTPVVPTPRADPPSAEADASMPRADVDASMSAEGAEAARPAADASLAAHDAAVARTPGLGVTGRLRDDGGCALVKSDARGPCVPLWLAFLCSWRRRARRSRGAAR